MHCFRNISLTRLTSHPTAAHERETHASEGKKETIALKPPNACQLIPIVVFNDVGRHRNHALILSLSHHAIASLGRDQEIG
jgi:hypothetical protein